MKAGFFILGLLCGIGASMTFWAYQASRLPTDRENLAIAHLLRKDIDRLEHAPDRERALFYASLNAFYLSENPEWGEFLPPEIQGDTFILRIRKPLFENVSLTLEGTGTLPPDDLNKTPSKENAL